MALALGKHYRMDADVFRKSITTGRSLRVKANVDQRTATALARELEGFGAQVKVAAHSTSRTSRPIDAIPSGMLTLATVDGEDPETLVPEPYRPPIPGPPRSSGPISAVKPGAVGAARPPNTAAQDAFSAPPDGDLLLDLNVHPSRGGTMAAEPERPSPTSPPRPKMTGERDAFAPPAESEQPLELLLQPAKVGRLAPQKEAPPPSTTGPRALAPEAHAPPPKAERPSFDLSAVADLALHDYRGRLGAGLALGLLLGFLPAHIYASFAEDKIDEIGAQLAHEPPAQSEAEYQLLLQQFDLAETRMGRVKTRIAVVTGVVWLAAGAAAAYGYWRLTAAAAARPSRDAA